ncbi:uncharacterized protein Tco025E_04501 [Trypanosoma conorhini]|uniref:Uncharacterized protein n=1 Tax=Trypanosoma conorhini TaxID=83891 RepID=A0A3R7LPL3_9TRYP|nr:uncharacterized protein Tco025E_04501 [Trypanosoma conorhini]RNF18384.1 hypothetical protein Tco025E_04501 [Trypanosoma conorhini]
MRTSGRNGLNYFFYRGFSSLCGAKLEGSATRAYFPSLAAFFSFSAFLALHASCGPCMPRGGDEVSVQRGVPSPPGCGAAFGVSDGGVPLPCGLGVGEFASEA